MFVEMTADNIDAYADDDFPGGAVEADILVDGEEVGSVTLVITDEEPLAHWSQFPAPRLRTWGGDARAWASADLLTFLDDAEEDDDFDRGDQIHEIVGAVQHAWEKS